MTGQLFNSMVSVRDKRTNVGPHLGLGLFIARLIAEFHGGIISAELDSDLKGTLKFLENIDIFTLAESLGGVESLIEHPAIMTHASIEKNIREDLGISDSLVRLSIGIEDPEDLKTALNKALDLI